jgi:hypothetical protein
MSEEIAKESANAKFEFSRNRRLFVAAGISLLIALLAWLITGGDSSNEASISPTSTSAGVTLTNVKATIVTKEELVAATKDLGFPIYWNGEMDDTNIELTVLTEGKVFVRYLPKNVDAGSPDKYFTVATYYDEAAFANVQNLGSMPGAKSINYSGGAVAASSTESDANIYFAFDGNPAIYNIYSPEPKSGWTALESGTISLLQ